MQPAGTAISQLQERDGCSIMFWGSGVKTWLPSVASMRLLASNRIASFKPFSCLKSRHYSCRFVGIKEQGKATPRLYSAMSALSNNSPALGSTVVHWAGFVLG